MADEVNEIPQARQHAGKEDKSGLLERFPVNEESSHLCAVVCVCVCIDIYIYFIYFFHLLSKECRNRPKRKERLPQDSGQRCDRRH